MADVIRLLATAMLELFFGATGEHLLRLVDVQGKIDDLASLFTGMAFWAVVGVTAISPK